MDIFWKQGKSIVCHCIISPRENSKEKPGAFLEIRERHRAIAFRSQEKAGRKSQEGHFWEIRERHQGPKKSRKEKPGGVFFGNK